MDWTTSLVESVPEYGLMTPVTVEQDDRPGVVTVATRIRGLIGALRTPGDGDADPLAEYSATDLLWLLDHLHRVVSSLQGQEDRVLGLLDSRASTRELARVLDMSHEGVRYRQAHQRDVTPEGR